MILPPENLFFIPKNQTDIIWRFAVLSLQKIKETMNLKYQRLINLLNCCEYKINDISAFRIINYEYSEIIDKCQLYVLEKHLESKIELYEALVPSDPENFFAILICCFIKIINCFFGFLLSIDFYNPQTQKKVRPIYHFIAFVFSTNP